MDFSIRVEKVSENQIIIESPAELGNQILNLLLKEGYTLTEFLHEAIGRSTNNGFVLKDPDMKYRL